MAMINCPECGKEVSSKSINCVHCGFPIKEKVRKKKMNKLIKLLLIVLPIIAIITVATIFVGGIIKNNIQDKKAIEDVIDLSGYTSKTTIYEVIDRFGDYELGMGNLSGTIYSASFEKTFLGVEGSLGVSVNSDDDTIRYSSYDSFRWDIIDEDDSEVFMRRFIKLYGECDSTDESWDDDLVEIWEPDESHPGIEIEITYTGKTRESGVSRVRMYKK